MTCDRELKVRCLELAARLLATNGNSAVDDVIKIGAQLYATLPPGPDASKTKQNMAKAVAKIPLQRESRPGQSQS